MKKTLLSSSAIAGAALISAPAQAFVESGDNLTVSLSGSYRFSVIVYDQDVRTGTGRGYTFRSDESEIAVSFDNVADNGLEYGGVIEIATQTDDGNNADETWAYLRGNWGEINIGDQDDAADRMAIGGEDAMVGRGGYDGAVGDVFFRGGVFTGPGATFTGDATKATYFTPRVFGFQAGASWTPDSGHAGGTAVNDDNDANVENAYSLGLNFSEDFNGFGVTLAGTWVGGDAEFTNPAGGAAFAADIGDAAQYQVGALLSYAGIRLGAAYGGGDNLAAAVVGGTLVEVDAGYWWDVGLSYGTGPWSLGVGVFMAEANNNHLGVAGAPDTTTDIYSITAGYDIAPGMSLATDFNWVEADNPGRVAAPVVGSATPPSNDGFVWVVSTIFGF